MTSILRYASIVAVLLFALTIAVVGGEVLCESCFHSCCVRAVRGNPVRRMLGRLRSAAFSIVRTFAGLTPHLGPSTPRALGAPLMAPSLALALRI